MFTHFSGSTIQQMLIWRKFLMTSSGRRSFCSDQFWLGREDLVKVFEPKPNRFSPNIFRFISLTSVGILLKLINILPWKGILLTCCSSWNFLIGLKQRGFAICQCFLKRKNYYFLWCQTVILYLNFNPNLSKQLFAVSFDTTILIYRCFLV